MRETIGETGQPKRCFVRWCLVLFPAVVGIGAWLFLATLFVTDARRQAARNQIQEPPSMTFHKNLARSLGEKQTNPPPFAPGTRESAASDIEATLAGWARLFEELERVQAEISSQENPYDVSWELLFKRESLRTEEEQAQYAQWREVEDAHDRDTVAANQAFIEAIRQMAARGGPVAVLDFSEEGERQVSPHLGDTRSVARFLATDAESKALQQDYATAVDDIIAILRLGLVLSEEPSMISQSSACALSQIAFWAVNNSFRGDDLPADGLFDALIAQTTQRPDREVLVEAFTADALQSLYVYDDLRAGDSTVLSGMFMASDLGRVLGSAATGETYDPERFHLHDITRSLTKTFYTSFLAWPWINWEEEAFIKTMSRISSVASLPLIDAVQAIDDIRRASPRVRLLSATVNCAEQSILSRALCNAHLDMMRIGLTLERRYGPSGPYPADLTVIAPQLCGAIPLDPFTGEPYRYEARENGFLLYSVGRNWTDDGGRPDYTHGDIVWRGE